MILLVGPILAPGRVRGDITTPSLQIDKGVVFEGRSVMEGVADKLSSAPKSSGAASSTSGSIGGESQPDKGDKPDKKDKNKGPTPVK